jgi:hypothetical protein
MAGYLLYFFESSVPSDPGARDPDYFPTAIYEHYLAPQILFASREF